MLETRNKSSCIDIEPTVVSPTVFYVTLLEMLSNYVYMFGFGLSCIFSVDATD